MRKTIDVTTAPRSEKTGGRPAGWRRAVTGALAVLILAPAAVVAYPGSASAADGCPATLGHLVDAVGVLPGTGPITGLANFIQGFTGSWNCADNQNLLEEMNQIAHDQAEIVFDENMQGIFSNNINKVITDVDNILPCAPPDPSVPSAVVCAQPSDMTDLNREKLVNQLEAAATAFETAEQTGKTLSYRALPAMSAAAAVKLSTITMAIHYEETRVDTWRKLQKDRVTEATNSLTYLAALETKLNAAAQNRYTRGEEQISRVCNSKGNCTTKFRLYVKDNDGGVFVWKSGTLTYGSATSSKPTAAQRAAYDAASTKANNHRNDKIAEMRDPYLTPAYYSIKAKLTAHANQPAETLFHTKSSVCNPDQYVILSAMDTGLAIRAVDGPVDASPLKLSGSLSAALADHSAQFELVRFGKSFYLKARDADLTVTAWPTVTGWGLDDRLRLHGTVADAKDNPHSLFKVYLMADEKLKHELILQISDADVTVRLVDGQKSGSQLHLSKTLAQANADASNLSRFHYTCTPESRPSAPLS